MKIESNRKRNSLFSSKYKLYIKFIKNVYQDVNSAKTC